MGGRTCRGIGGNLRKIRSSAYPKEKEGLYTQKAKVGQILNGIPLYEWQEENRRCLRGVLWVTNEAEDLHFLDDTAEFILDEEGDGYFYKAPGKDTIHCHFVEGRGFILQLWEKRFPISIARDVPVAHGVCIRCGKIPQECVYCPIVRNAICESHCRKCRFHSEYGNCSYRK